MRNEIGFLGETRSRWDVVTDRTPDIWRRQHLTCPGNHRGEITARGHCSAVSRGGGGGGAITAKPCTDLVDSQPLLEIGVRPLVVHVSLDQLLHPLLLQTVGEVVEGVLVRKIGQRLYKTQTYQCETRRDNGHPAIIGGRSQQEGKVTV